MAKSYEERRATGDWSGMPTNIQQQLGIQYKKEEKKKSKSTAKKSSSSSKNKQKINPEQKSAVTTPVIPPATQPNQNPPAKKAKVTEQYNHLKFERVDIGSSTKPFVPTKGSTVWYDGKDSNEGSTDIDEGSTVAIKKSDVKGSRFDNSINAPRYTPVTGYTRSGVWGSGEQLAFLMRKGYDKAQATSLITKMKKIEKSKAKVNGTTLMAEYSNSWADEGRRLEMLNGDTTIIQNAYQFPFTSVKANTNLSSPVKAKYDYRVIMNDPRLPEDSPVRNMEDRLMNMRAALGIPVHGNNDIARSMKMYMYNRFKVPDLNLAHNKSFTHVFFTRPDLNLLRSANIAQNQVVGHTDTALLWKRNPELFKLLTDYSKCGDADNLNLLLSNQVTSFQLDDEKLATRRHGKSWAEHEMVYGEQYTGRTAGEFTCSFDETAEYSVINLMKLWITYIDNVGRGAWSPYYPTDWNGQINSSTDPDERCHVYSRALDYGASAYVFKCGPDGEDILYWSKYYGVFPIVTGSSALSWDKSSPVGDAPKLNITFAYSFKKDLSPISLLEFNHAANADGNMDWVPAFDENLGHTSRPFVGSPYIELDLGVPDMDAGDVNRASKRTQIRLKFRPDTSSARRDDILFKSYTAKSSVRI